MRNTSERRIKIKGKVPIETTKFNREPKKLERIVQEKDLKAEGDQAKGAGFFQRLLIILDIFLWNVRSANDAVKRKLINILLKSQKVNANGKSVEKHC